MITAEIKSTWDHEIDGYIFSTYEVVATVAKANNRAVVVDVKMIGFQGPDVISYKMPSDLNNPAMMDLNKNLHFTSEARKLLEKTGETFEAQSSFQTFFVNHFNDVFGIKAGGSE